MPDRPSPTPGATSPPNPEVWPAPSLKWGVGRVAFFACLDEIKDEIGQGWPLKVIHARHREKLRVSYSGFCKLVERHAAEARVPSASSPRPARQKAAKTPAPARPGGETGQVEVETRTGPSPETPMEGALSHAGQQPTQTFIHDPVERPGDYERLLGTRRR
jgi:hypothetical protein